MGLAKVHCGATPPSVMVLFSFITVSLLAVIDEAVMDIDERK